MKKKKSNNHIIVMATTIMILFQSCTSDVENNIQHNESYSTNYQIEILAKQYGDIYEDIFFKIYQEYKTLSKESIHIDKEKYSKHFINEYMKNLHKKQKELLQNDYFTFSRNAYETIDVSKKFPEFIDSIRTIMFNVNLDLLDIKISEFYTSEDYRELTSEEQQFIKLQLLNLKAARDIIVSIIVKHYKDSFTQSRMSPGDRMVYSEAASQMSDEELDRAISLGMQGISWVTVPVVGTIIAVVDFVSALF